MWDDDVAMLLRGNAAQDAPRPLSNVTGLSVCSLIFRTPRIRWPVLKLFQYTS